MIYYASKYWYLYEDRVVVAARYLLDDLVLADPLLFEPHELLLVLLLSELDFHLYGRANELGPHWIENNMASQVSRKSIIVKTWLSLPSLPL